MGLENIINSGKRILGTSLLAGVLATVPALTGCGKIDNDQNSGQNYSSATQAPGISKELQEQWPIWEPADLEINKHKGPAVSYDQILNIKPEFYKGSMPLQYTSTKTPEVGFIGTSKVLRNEFKDFSNYFIYDGFNLVGAVSVNNNNKMVAEAKINLYMEEEGKTYSPRAEAEEFHYDDGLLVFHCKSQFENGTGIKKKETKSSGKKRRDYFFILPMGISE